MWRHNPEIEGRIGELGANACVELFAAYEVELNQRKRAWDGESRLLSGSIGFVGKDIRGTCLLAATEEAVVASCVDAGSLRDWVGELTNQFVGRLKGKLSAFGVDVFVTTPIVHSGVRIQPLPRGTLEPFEFAATQGCVLGWVEVETRDAFALGEESAERSNVEGDVILF